MTTRLLLTLALSIPAAAALWGCNGGGSSHGGGAPPTTVPTVTALNGSTTPTSPLGVSLEIAGTFFGTSAGSVRFVQGSTQLDVAVTSSNSWTDTSVLVTVPNNGLTAPGTVEVSVIRADGLGGVAATLTLVVTPNFSPSSITWGATQALPVGLRGHGAAAVAAGSNSGWVFVVGGNSGAANLNSAIVASLDANGNVGAWQQAASLPAPRAFAGVAVASASNAPVSSSTATIYVVGGQATGTDAPGGTSTVYRGTVTLSTGAVSWATTTDLPETRVGARAAVANGYLHVVGGLNASGNPIGAVASAPINADGSLGAWSEVSSLNTPVAFQGTFAFGGFLYAIGGDASATTNPFDVSNAGATRFTQYAPIRNGVVGSWTNSSQLTQARTKANVLFAFGQLMLYEGAYGNTNFEAVRSSVQPAGSLASWNGLTGGSIPALNVYNAAAISSPLFTPTNQPRFLLLGGDLVQTPGNPQASVRSTTAP